MGSAVLREHDTPHSGPAVHQSKAPGRPRSPRARSYVPVSRALACQQLVQAHSYGRCCHTPRVSGTPGRCSRAVSAVARSLVSWLGTVLGTRSTVLLDGGGVHRLYTGSSWPCRAHCCAVHGAQGLLLMRYWRASRVAAATTDECTLAMLVPSSLQPRWVACRKEAKGDLSHSRRSIVPCPVPCSRISTCHTHVVTLAGPSGHDVMMGWQHGRS